MTTVWTLAAVMVRLQPVLQLLQLWLLLSHTSLTGAFSREIHCGSLVCVEIDATRVAESTKAPRARAERVQHCVQDYLDVQFLEDHKGAFDVVVTNPHWHLAMQTLCAAAMLAHKDTVIVALLPSAFFDSCAKLWVSYSCASCTGSHCCS